MRRLQLAIGAAALALIAAPAMAQSTEGPMAPPNSMNTTGPTTCTAPNDVTCTNRAPKAVIAPPSNAVPSEETPNQLGPAAMPPAAVPPAPVTDTSLPTRQYSSTGTDVQVISNGPVPDTAENRAKYGGPRSRAGKRTAPAGN
jgi:hypothetical protein